MKNNVNRLIVVFCLLIVLVFTFGAWSCGPTPPWNYNNVIWYSENPFIEVECSAEKDCVGVMKFGGKEQQIQLLWGPTGSFNIVDQTKNDGHTTVETISIISGKVKYDKDMATLIIEEDSFFNYQYEEIVLKRREV